MKIKHMIQLLVTCLAIAITAAAQGQIVISEFMAANSHGIVDEDGTHSDWLELFNAGTTPVVLDGWYLTDDSASRTKWQFPQGMAPLQPNSYLLVWASGKDRRNAASPLHTNFKLGREGGYLALLASTADVVSAFESYPPQIVDVSYGRDRVDVNLVGFFYNPTPGAQNVNGSEPPTFSHASGIYTNATIALTISATAGSIYYTSDGSLPTTNSTLYTAPITLATNTTIKARVFPPTGTSDLPSDVVARNFIFLDDTTSEFTSNIPLLIISTEGRQIVSEIPPGGTRTNGSVVILDVKNAKSSLRAAPDLQVLAGLEYFGQTSIGFAKRPIRFETKDASANDLKVSILGLPPGADFKLRNPYDDKTLLNDFLTTELFEQMGHYSVRRRFVEVFVDVGGGRLNYTTDYYGVMVLLESIQIDQNRLNLARIPSNATNETVITGGYIFKKDKDSSGDLSFGTVGGNGFSGQSLKMHDPKPNDLRVSPVNGPLTVAGSKQVGYLTNYLKAMERALYATNWLSATGTNHYSNYMDVDSFVDLHWMVEFPKYIDGYRISTFFHKDRGGKVSAGPIWGWNFAFGNGNYLFAGQTNGWYYDQLGDNDHIWLRRLIAGNPSPNGTTGDPDFLQKIADRWGELRTNIFNGSRLLARIDELATYLGEAAKRDFAKYQTLGIYIWPNPDGGVATAGSVGSADSRDVDYVRPKVYNDSTPNSIIWQMKKYVFGRYLWIDGQFTPPPVIHVSPGAVTNGFPVVITATSGAQVYYRTDGADPRGPGGITNGILYSGPIVASGNMKIVARAIETNKWEKTWSGKAQVSLFTSLPSLRITEIMYHPEEHPENSNINLNAEYIKVRNVGDAPLNVNGFTLTGGVQFQFPNVTLQAGQSALIVNNIAAFHTYYGTNFTNALILGEYVGELKDSGDRLVLTGNLGEPILDFAFDDKWYPATDGLGFSLVAVNENGSPDSWRFSAQWRPSNAPGGSPGQDEPAATPIPRVLVNEVLAHTASGSDAIELHNPSQYSVDIGGWFLSDDFKIPRKFTIPANTVISPLGYVVFYESNSFNFPSNAAGSFALGAKGDDIWLFSGNGTNLSGYAHGFTFGGSPSGRTLGRHSLSTGAEILAVQTSESLGGANSGPAVGPIIITEINAHPPNIGVNWQPYDNTLDEFIVFQNISSNSVALYDVTYPTNRWKLDGSVKYVFPALQPNTTVAPGAFVMMVGFDPEADPSATAAFRARNGVPATMALLGPWQGTLGNKSGTVQLLSPDMPDPDGTVVFYVADEVRYSNQAPWQSGWNATGLSLHRLSANAYGNDPTNWAAGASSPGTILIPSGIPPAIMTQPADQTAPTGRTLNLNAMASGTDVHYQWQRNGIPLPGATNSVLIIPNFQDTNSGPYNILAFNSAGAVLGHEFRLSARIGLDILRAPLARVTTNGGTTNFSVSATGTGPLGYRWKLNGLDVTQPNASGATSELLTITNVQAMNEGHYTVSISDDYDTITSSPVDLKIVYPAVFTVHPLSQTVVEGGSVTLSASASGTTPMTFRWRKQIGTFTFDTFAVVTGSSNSFITLTNFQLVDATNYNVALSNVVGFARGGPFFGVSSNAVLTVLADSDHDGLPDVWENGRPEFSATDPTDANRDDDGDGMSNLAEFIAGTDYLDPQSYLKVNIGPGGATVSFAAVSNRTYSVLYFDALGSGITQKLADALAFPSNSVRAFVDPNPGTNRFYRLVTPIQP